MKRGEPLEVSLKYLVEDRDRHGNLRRYVRVPGQRKVRIKLAPGEHGFMEAYTAALAGAAALPTGRAPGGSYLRLCHLYFASSTFKALDVSTKNWQRRALETIAQKHGAKPVALMAGRHVRRIRDERPEQPAAGNTRLKALRAMFRWAVEEDEAPHDPTLGVRKIRYVTKGHHSWTQEEIEQYKRRHKRGTNARLALSILRFTTGRREDAVRLGKPNVKNGRVRFRQAKNEHRNPIDIDIPLHAELRADIEATRSGHLTFLVTSFGRPYTPAGFGNAMRDWCNQANLPHCSAHGLRKSTPTRMAERGATPHELMAITGHTTLEEVERYTRAAGKKLLADSAMKKHGR